MYRLTDTNLILRIADNAFIPADLGNSDYKEFIKWTAEGNTPTPADLPTKAEENAPLISKLADIDLKSIRAIREYIASKPDCSMILKTIESEAIAERAKLKP